MLMNDMYAVIVLYNTKLTDSITCRNILKIKNHKIHTIIVDNSTRRNNNAQLSKSLNFAYLSMHGNAGLSKAYNKVLDYLEGKNGIVIWFDDDTNVTQEYFDKLAEAIEKNPQIDIFVPVIMGQDNKFWSPNRARFFKNKQLKDVDEKIDNSEFNAINSCTACRLKIFKNYRYNEKLFLDQVDHNFCRDQRLLHRKFYKINCIIHHNFSTKSKASDYNSLVKRYEVMIPDFLTYCNICGKKYYYLGYVKVLGWGVREAYKNKKPAFLLWCCKKVINWRK